MALILTVIIISIGAALMVNIYSIFEPFHKDLGDINHYNVAYYGAISSLERANLVLRNHFAGFEGSGGWKDAKKNISFGSDSDLINSSFGILGNNKTNSGMRRQIKNLNNYDIIPTSGNGNIDYELQYANSKDFNKLEYNMSEEFLLYKDNTLNDKTKYYTNYDSNRIEDIDYNTINLQLRLPPLIKQKFSSDLNIGQDIDGDGISNDILVNRTVFGVYDDGVNKEKFSIYPTINVDYSNGNVNSFFDSGIRENILSNTDGSTNASILFGNNNNPIQQNPILDYLFNSIPEKIGSSYITPSSYSWRSLFNENKFKEKHIKFSLINLAETSNSQIYPFVEYKVEIDSNSTPFPDRFFEIEGVGKVGRYQVMLKQSKPVVESYGYGDFTLLF